MRCEYGCNKLIHIRKIAYGKNRHRKIACEKSHVTNRTPGVTKHNRLNKVHEVRILYDGLTHHTLECQRMSHLW